MLAEAGTGVGKTLGYVAPASVWAQKNQGPVWLSTFTRNLQHQIDTELDRLFPEMRDKQRKVVVRKGRENYLCLLNYEEAVRGLQVRPQDALAVGLMARWTRRTRDGDMVGGDFPGWLPDLVGRGRTLGLTDRRGECIYAACPHYKKCFIEGSIRRARRAEIVVANHALVMIQAALGGGEEGTIPARTVFDEGHHVFDAADSAFSAHLSGRETVELRRWLLGAERSSRSSSRIRGLKRRVEDLLGEDPQLPEDLEETLRAARCLPADGWHGRLTEDAAAGPAERFLAAVRQQVYARVSRPGDPYSLETELRPAIQPLVDGAGELDTALEALYRPMKRLHDGLHARLDAEADDLDSDTRRRIEATCRSLTRRGLLQVSAWRQMLQAAQDAASPEAFVDWLMVERADGRDIDVGLHRHWVDPTQPFAQYVAQPSQGMVITSATLTDGSGDREADWQAAELRTGATHLPAPAIRAEVKSPFDYPANTRVLVVTDVRKDDLSQVAAAYRELFLASHGGALGLFTAISRLRRVHEQIGPALEETGLSLFAQHVDGLDVSTLVDIFRAEEDACLLGTDAVRDGVDVPGRSLRLIVFDRVPWPRPDIRHKARRELFGKRRYDDMLTRLRLKQAFGRVVPAALADAHHPRPHAIADHGAGQDGAPVVEHAHNVAVGDASRLGVGRADQDRLAPLHGILVAQDAGAVELRVQAVLGVRGVQVERERRIRLALPFDRLHPGRMGRTVIVAHGLDGAGEQFDLARGRTQGLQQRFLPEVGIADVVQTFLVRLEHQRLVPVPEGIEIRHVDAPGLGLGQGGVIEALDPFHFGLAVVEAVLVAQRLRQALKMSKSLRDSYSGSTALRIGVIRRSE